jgi:hypothetical protein
MADESPNEFQEVAHSGGQATVQVKIGRDLHAGFHEILRLT